MNLNPRQRQHLKLVIEARDRAEKAEREKRRIALEAVAAGVPAIRVANALRTSRMQLWRWENERSPRAADTAEGTTTSEATDEVPAA